jgi:hypothetical protein
LLFLFLMGDACVFTTKPALPLTEDAAVASDSASPSYDGAFQSGDVPNGSADNCHLDVDAGVNGAYVNNRGEVCDPAHSSRDGGSDAARDASSSGDVADSDVTDGDDAPLTDCFLGSEKP